MLSIDGSAHTPSVGYHPSIALSLFLYVLLHALLVSIEGGSYVNYITDRTQKRLTSPSDPRRCCDRGTTTYPACFTYSELYTTVDTCCTTSCHEHTSTESGTRLTRHRHADCRCSCCERAV